MMNRNLSPWLMFLHMAEKHRPRYGFEGQTQTEWRAWNKEALPEVLKTLGPMPEKVSPNAEVVAQWEAEGVVMERVLIDVQEGLSAALLINRPPRPLSKTPGPRSCVVTATGHTVRKR